MKKFIVVALTAAVLIAAYLTKPSDKKCIVATVKAVWGDITPGLNVPQYYEQFMNVTSKEVIVNDWVFLKQMRYRFKDSPRTVGIAAFNHTFTF